MTDHSRDDHPRPDSHRNEPSDAGHGDGDGSHGPLREGLRALGRWPVLRQLRRGDWAGLGDTAASPRTESIAPRTRRADRVARSICPYCAVGCAQLVYVEDDRITDVEGDPDSPISRGCLCPKGAATFQLVCGSHRHRTVLHRRPGASEWEPMELEEAMERVARKIQETRDATWQETDDDGRRVARTLGIASIGGATLDNEENYLIKKLLTGGLGIVQVENQARI